MVDDGSGLLVKRTTRIWRPVNLVNSPSHLVPLVITFDYASSNWVPEQGSGKYVVISLPAPHAQNEYATRDISPLTGYNQSTCGPTGTGACDDIPWVVASLNAVECNGAFPCQNIDQTKVYATGGSRGGEMTMDTMCDTRTSSRVRGYSIVSAAFWSTNQQTAPICPALLGTGSPNRNISPLWIYGSSDPYAYGPSCSVGQDCPGTGYATNSGYWAWGADPMATSVFGAPLLGCKTTPATTTFGNTGKLIKHVYTPCTAGSRIATGTIEAVGGGHVPDGFDGLDIAAQSWSFFQSYG